MNKENVSSLKIEKVEITDNSQKGKLVLKEVPYKNLVSWNEQVEIEIERTKAFSIQEHKENKTDILKENNIGNSLLDNIQKTNPYTNLQEDSNK
ncbi:8276_t:CDS:2 [Cetraspora pellucida]|uniref:8276_t:CDS:1 n=1 Tax=Cetraspora pellucida TaxID=1433469 RepID=A0ACA9KRT6_9GLOM|nr:8276_t:CDS:2 [Cetraspora pellucida]